jgi:hypothetical protein
MVMLGWLSALCCLSPSQLLPDADTCLAWCRDAFMLSFMFGQVPPNRISFIISMQHPNHVHAGGCKDPDCIDKACMGNRLQWVRDANKEVELFPGTRIPKVR